MNDREIILSGFRGLRESLDSVERENRESHQQVIIELNEVKFRQGVLEQKVSELSDKLNDPEHLKDMSRVRSWRETQDKVTGHALLVMTGSFMLGLITMIVVGVQYWVKDKLP